MHRLSHNTPICTTDEIRRIESLAAADDEPPPLMERAGYAAAELARELALSGKRVFVIAGPGNNGGDALVVARQLKSAWFNVEVLFTGDAATLPRDARAAHKAWLDAGGLFVRDLPRIRECGLIVDGLLGIGLRRDLSGRYADVVSWMNDRNDVPLLALDIPSGLDSDTGRVCGIAVRASHTITFIALKAGLLTLDGSDHCGEVHLATLGLDPVHLAATRGRLIAGDVLDSAALRRKRNTHKGDYGSVGVIGGASGMVGAALLAGRAALKLGAGRVYVGLAAEDAPAVDAVQPELMVRRAEDVLSLDHLACIAVGPGLGQTERSQALLLRALELSAAAVLDADALNLIAQQSTIRATLLRRTKPTLLTPHPAEAARLLDTTTSAIQADRVKAALELAKAHRCNVVLKGAGSICAFPDGTWGINTSGNPGMASGGMGDVLTGMLAALLSQGMDPRAALECGVYLHGAAADALTQGRTGPIGLTASEIIDAARNEVNRAVGPL